MLGIFYLNNVLTGWTADMDDRISDEFHNWAYQEMDAEAMAHINDLDGEDSMSHPTHMGTRRQFLAVTFPCYSDRLDGLERTYFSKNKFKRARTYKQGKPSRVKPAHKR